MFLSTNDRWWHPDFVLNSYVTYAEQNGTMWKGLCIRVDQSRTSGTDWLGVGRVGGRSFMRFELQFLFSTLVIFIPLSFFLANFSSFIINLLIKIKEVSVLTEENLSAAMILRQLSASKGACGFVCFEGSIFTWIDFSRFFSSVSNVLLHLCSLRLSDLSFLFSNILHWEWMAKVYSWFYGCMEPYTTRRTQNGMKKGRGEKKKEVSLKAISFFSLIFFTPFYLPLVHTMEAIFHLPEPATKCFQICVIWPVCSALPTASPLKTLRPQWHKTWNALDAQQHHVHFFVWTD